MDKYRQGSADEHWLRVAVELARSHMKSGRSGPFGAVITKDHEVVGLGWNMVVMKGDPTAHAEMVAIRRAAKRLGTFRLNGCVLYSSCEPCPMCLSAAFWARIESVVFGATRFDAGKAGFDDLVLHSQFEDRSSPKVPAMRRIPCAGAKALLEEWSRLANKVPY
jgi:tRNA(Arg) A34 adenosine deaminase TadA